MVADPASTFPGPLPDGTWSVVRFRGSPISQEAQVLSAEATPPPALPPEPLVTTDLSTVPLYFAIYLALIQN